MTTIFTHAVVAVAIGVPFRPTVLPRKVWILGAICSMVPDADVLGFAFGVQYADFWGHRGFTHSLLFAALLALVATLRYLGRPCRAAVAVYLFLATASHGLLDALTDGGLGVAFFSPFDDTRYFLPAQPVHVAHIGLGFFSAGSIAVMVSEMLWIWIPSLAILTGGLWFHRQRDDATIRSFD
ncbi:MAG: metal-dependent hydrolase [Planctomycetes bacterium]|nr:metal-dependent hydrolase [Planctomycetota bacterium]